MMPWARLDDAFPDHPKIAGLSDAAFRMHVRGICYAARLLTDGRVPKAVAEEWMTSNRRRTRRELNALKELLDAGIWLTKRRDYVIHDYLEYNPSRAKVAAKRAADRQRLQVSRTRFANDSRASRRVPSPGSSKEQKNHRDVARDVDATAIGDVLRKIGKQDG
jgi:hypothetical protein